MSDHCGGKINRDIKTAAKILYMRQILLNIEIIEEKTCCL